MPIKVEEVSKREKSVKIQPTKLKLMVYMIKFLRDNFDDLALNFVVSETETMKEQIKCIPIYDKFSHEIKGHSIAFKGRAIVLMGDGKLRIYHRQNLRDVNGWSSKYRGITFGRTITQAELSPHKMLYQLKENFKQVNPNAEVYFKYLDWTFNAIFMDIRNEKIVDFSTQTLNTLLTD